LAAVLLTAALLKTYQLATVPTLGEGLFHARWFNIFVVEFEVFFAFWLFSGLFSKWTRLVSIALFSVFALVSLFKAVSGETSCGCFGNVTVNPWITMGFDVVIVVLLAYFSPKKENFTKYPSYLLATCFGAGVILCVLMYDWIAQSAFERLEHIGQVLNGGVVQLEPETWVGKKLPLLNYIMASELPKEDVWLILLYNHRCSSCRECVVLYTDLAAEFIEEKNCPKIMLLETPPFEKSISETAQKANVIYGQLDGARKWHANTPVLLLVDQGTVQNIFTSPRDTALIRSIWGCGI
jgi:hypothetical protein